MSLQAPHMTRADAAPASYISAGSEEFVSIALQL